MFIGSDLPGDRVLLVCRVLCRRYHGNGYLTLVTPKERNSTSSLFRASGTQELFESKEFSHTGDTGEDCMFIVLGLQRDGALNQWFKLGRWLEMTIHW